MSLFPRIVQDDEIDAWLGGPGVNDLTPAQQEEFARLVRAYHATTLDRVGEAADYAEEDEAAWIAALEHVTTGLDVAEAGRAYRSAQTRAYAAAVVAVLAGTSEVEAARAATISRATLRKALGKA